MTADPNTRPPATPQENFAEAHKEDRLPQREDGLNGAPETVEDLIDEEVEQSFPASDPPVVTRRSTKEDAGV